MKIKEKNVFNSILINARSVLPKLCSLNETLNELAADVCIITETWLKEKDSDNQELIDFQERTGYKLIRRDRFPGRGGGVGILYNTSSIEMVKIKIPFNKHEIVAAIGRRAGQRKKIVVIGAYLPPNYCSARNKSFYVTMNNTCLLYTSPSPRDRQKSRMPSSA